MEKSKGVCIFWLIVKRYLPFATHARLILRHVEVIFTNLFSWKKLLCFFSFHCDCALPWCVLSLLNFLFGTLSNFKINRQGKRDLAFNFFTSRSHQAWCGCQIKNEIDCDIIGSIKMDFFSSIEDYFCGQMYPNM